MACGPTSFISSIRNLTLLRSINLEREAQHLSLVDLSQAFGTTLPVSRTTISWTGDENKLVPERRDAVEAVREGVYLRSGAMTGYKRDDATEEVREGVYLRSGAMTGYKRENAEPVREGAYLRNGTMAGSKRDDDADAEPVREGAYLRSGTMAGSKKRNDAAEPVREGSYLRSGTMAGSKKRDDGLYGALLNREDLALGALERVNIVYRILGEPEITLGEAQEMGSHGDQFLNDYWQTSMHHGSFWKTDQAWGEPNFIEGGQANGFGFTQSSFHKLHCLANIRTILAWHIMGEGENMSRDMTAHAIHCLVSSPKLRGSMSERQLSKLVLTRAHLNRSTFAGGS